MVVPVLVPVLVLVLVPVPVRVVLVLVLMTPSLDRKHTSRYVTFIPQNR